MSKRGKERAMRFASMGVALLLLLLVGLTLRVEAPVGAATLAATPEAATPVAVESLVIEGDPIVALVPVPPGNEAVYVVGGNGLYRSDDGGRSWEARGPLPPPGQVVAAGDGDPLLAGDHPPCLRGGSLPPLQRSDDGGATWAEVEGAAGIQPFAIEIGSRVALGASCRGGQVSNDGGLTWQPAALAEPGYGVTALALVPSPDGDDALVAGNSEGGTGRLWRVDLSAAAHPQIGPMLRQFGGAGAVAGSGQHLVLGTATGVATSSDGGETWRESRNGLEDVTVSVDPLQQPIPETERARGIRAVAIVTDDPDHLFAGTVGGIYESIDGGQTWRRVTGVEGRVSRLVLTADASRLFAESESGVVAVSITSL